MRKLAAIMVIFAYASHAAEFQLLEGHGGPIMGVAISETGDTALTASFDNSVGYWNLDSGQVTWLEAHEAAVKSVLFLPDNRAVSAGDDFAIYIWDLNDPLTGQRLGSHKGKIMSLALSPSGQLIASASWDGTIGIWDAENGQLIRFLEGHTANVNDVVFANDKQLISASYDGTIRLWDVSNGEQLRTITRHGFGVNTLVLNPTRDWLAYGAVDGGTRAFDLTTGKVLADLTLDRRPILAMAANREFTQIAVGDGQGYIMVVNTIDWSIERDFHAAKNGPIWALAYSADGQRLLAGGIEDNAYFWPINADNDLPQMSDTPRDFHADPASMTNGERQFRRKCSVCHNLAPGTARKAGPSLYGIFGRKAGAYAGYSYSNALDDSDIIWSAHTIDQLFDQGPDNFIPGTKMPMQRIAKSSDRRDLVEFLRHNTGE